MCICFIALLCPVPEIQAALLGKAQQPQEQRCPFLSVRVGFLCVQTVAWLPDNLQGVGGPCSIRQVQRPVVRWPPAVLRVCRHLQVEVRYMRSVSGFFFFFLSLSLFFFFLFFALSLKVDFVLFASFIILGLFLSE